MPSLDNKVPPPIVTALCGVAMWSISTVTPSIAVAYPLRISASAIIALLAIFFCVAGVVSFQRAKTTVNPLKPETASSLVNSGIYRISRNPMYVGLVLLLIAWSVYLSSPFALAGVIAFVLYINRFQIQPEERALATLFGNDFEIYKSSVRKWL